MAKTFIAGFIRAPHGVAGECKVESASGAYEHIALLTEVALRHGDKTETHTVESVHSGGNCVFMKFAGIDSPEEVRKYNGWEIVVPREYAYQPKNGEWYIDDLINCSLVYEGKDRLSGEVSIKTIGTITDVLEGGAAYLLEVRISEECSVLADNIKYTASGKIRTVYVPFSDAHIGKVDIENKAVLLMHLWILE
ncbi:MAG: 16S rRNA processing protein RimM [Treponema sp.]|nr:16S rRNA processing protein RimM [Treponema sp.]